MSYDTSSKVSSSVDFYKFIQEKINYIILHLLEIIQYLFETFFFDELLKTSDIQMMNLNG